MDGLIDPKMAAEALRLLADMLEASPFIRIKRLEQSDWDSLNKATLTVEWAWPSTVPPPTPTPWPKAPKE